MLTPEELDETYTHACQTMTGLGADKTELFLARLCLLLMKQVGAATPILSAIDAAAKSVREG